MRRRLPTGTLTTALFALLLTSGPSVADSEISYAQAQLMAGTCFACHATDGRPNHDGPVLGGRDAETLFAQLMAFKDNRIPGTTVMNRIAAGYSEAELEAIAEYFAVINVGRD